MNRRTFLAGVTAGSSALVAGCGSVFGDDSTPTDAPESGPDDPGQPVDGIFGDPEAFTYFFTLYNHENTAHTLSLDVEAEDGTTTLDETYRLEGRSAMEHEPLPGDPLPGDPAEVTVRLDDREPERFEWPAVESCRDENKGGLPGLEIRVLSEGDADRPRLYQYWSCQAVAIEG